MYFILFPYDRIALTYIPPLLTNMENFLPEVTSNNNSAVLSTVAMDYRVCTCTHVIIFYTLEIDKILLIKCHIVNVFLYNVKCFSLDEPPLLLTLSSMKQN